MSDIGNTPTARILELQRELAAAQATINSIMPQPCCEKFETCGNDRCVPLLKAKLARYESAVMPEEPRRFGYTPDKSGRRTGLPVVWADDYDKLRTFAAAQKVRADENERDARRYRGLRDTVAATSGPAICMRVYDGYHFQLRGVACDKETDKALAAGKGE